MTKTKKVKQPENHPEEKKEDETIMEINDKTSVFYGLKLNIKKIFEYTECEIVPFIINRKRFELTFMKEEEYEIGLEYEGKGVILKSHDSDITKCQKELQIRLERCKICSNCKEVYLRWENEPDICGVCFIKTVCIPPEQTDDCMICKEVMFGLPTLKYGDYIYDIGNFELNGIRQLDCCKNYFHLNCLKKLVYDEDCKGKKCPMCSVVIQL